MSYNDDNTELSDKVKTEKKIIHIVNTGFQDAPKATGVLSKLFRKMCKDLNIKAFAWAQLMTNYLNNPANGVANTPKDRSTARGNMNKELIKGQMSWLIFMRAIRFFGAVKADFTVKITLADGRSSEHTVTMFDRVPKNQPIKRPYDKPIDVQGLKRPLNDDTKPWSPEEHHNDWE